MITELIFYSAELDEIVILEQIGKGVNWECSDEGGEKVRNSLRQGIGFVFITDWIFLGAL